ncbi:MAG TPA: energy-coupling factor transporter transmembrane component T [Kineosporiaceae bacterium]|nr:energy-coupling factor transporter transmembrane component T [Kineosporiaceae bacterium]
MTATLDAPAADVDTGAFAARANPVAKLAVGLAVAIALILSLDVVTAGTALALELLALPWCGVGPRALWRRGRLLLLTAGAAGLGTALFGVTGPVAGAAVALRILAVALPGVVLVATTDATDLADALAQVARLPHRFVLAALAATRLLGVLADEWAVLGLARRARGLGDAGPLGRLRDHLGRVLALLVVAVRRATTLATAMEARGFGVGGRRTWARPSRLHGRDAVVVGYGLLVAVASTAAGVAAGTWHLVLT